MKNIIAALFLSVVTLVAQQTNQIIVQSTNVPAKVVLVVVVQPEYLPRLMATISNFNSQMEVMDSRGKHLKTLIRLQEDRIKEVYSGYPDMYTGDGSPESQRQLDKLIAVWKEKNAAISNVNSMKLELKKLYGTP